VTLYSSVSTFVFIVDVVHACAGLQLIIVTAGGGRYVLAGMPQNPADVIGAAELVAES